MNILEQTEALKDMPDAVLIQQMKMPTGQIAPIFITSELKRRKRMRDEYARREAADTPTVAEEVVMAAGMPSGGIADAARALAPKTDMGQNTGMAEMAPRAATRAPQPMASGGIVGMRQGGKLVKVGRANFYAFSDGEVFVENPDGSREAVTDPRVLGVVRAQANVGPERQESAAPLGSEILQEAAPQRPTLDSTLSSDRPFSPLAPEVDDTRPAVPSSLGMGGERPSTLTAATQPTALSEMEKARLATEFTQQQELARAIRDQQDQGIASLNPPDALSNPERDFDPFAPLGQERAARSVLAQQAPDNAKAEEELTKFLKSQEMAGGRPGGTTIEDTRMMNMLNAQRQAEEVANLEALRKTQPNVDVGTDPVFGDTMGLQEVLAGDFDPVSAAPSAPAVDQQQALIDAMNPAFDRFGGDALGAPKEEAKAKKEEAQALEYAATIPPLKQILLGADGAGPDPFNRPPPTATSSDAQSPLEEALRSKAEGPDIVGEVEELNRAIETATANNDDFLAATLTTRRNTLVKFLEGRELATDAQEAVGGALRTVGEYASDLGGLLATKYREIVTANIDPVKAAEKLKEYAQSDEYKFSLREQQAAERENTERAREQRLIDLSGKFPEQPRYDVDQLPGPIGAGTEADPITMGDAPVGIEAARPKARPQGVAPVADTTTPTTPDGGGITTVSTKAINDAAKSTGLGVDAWLSIAKGGAAVAASKNPTLLGALGEGAGVAASSLIAQRASDKAASLKQDQIDATLEAARIRAAAAGKRGMAPPTGSSVLTYLSGQLDQAKLDLQTLESAKSRTKKTSEWKLDKVRTEQEIEQLQRDINTLLYGGSVASAGGTGSQAKNIDVSKG
jgi:hypothetical protein